LRDLDSDWTRDAVCARAIEGDQEAVTAAIDAGYVPSKQELRLPFLFLTGQWERYDAKDRDGRNLREYLAAHPHPSLVGDIF
jgi:hypothetical protein